MPQLRKDPIAGRWVIINNEQPMKADSFEIASREKSSKVCPFCPGNEGMTPPEITSYGRKGAKGGAPWQVRVVPNKFPALRIEEKTEKTAIGIYDKIGGFGAHEVIIENPNHDKEMADLTVEQVEVILRVYRDRCQDLKKDPRFKYVLIFKNYGADAGATLEHPHSQLIALPVVPSRVQGELKGALKHFDYTERCIFCDILEQKTTRKNLEIMSDQGIIAMAPFASRFPFETWVFPESHESYFEALTDEKLRPLALVLKTTLLKIKTALKDPSYNFMIHTHPVHGKEQESFHWHIEIIPHLTEVSGFELGTGFYLNPTSPELAAQTLRDTAVKVE